MIQGDEDERIDGTGWSVSSAGDMNGDGYADVIVSEHGHWEEDYDASEAYVVYGKAEGIGTVDATGRRVVALVGLSPAGGFVIRSASAGGFSVSSAGCCLSRSSVAGFSVYS